MEEGLPKRRHTATDVEMDASIADFMQPRDAILTVASSFYSHCQTRVRELRRFLPELITKTPDFFDYKSQAVRVWIQPMALELIALSANGIRVDSTFSDGVRADRFIANRH